MISRIAACAGAAILAAAMSLPITANASPRHSAANSTSTEFSAARRHHHYGHYAYRHYPYRYGWYRHGYWRYPHYGYYRPYYGGPRAYVSLPFVSFGIW